MLYILISACAKNLPFIYVFIMYLFMGCVSGVSVCDKQHLFSGHASLSTPVLLTQPGSGGQLGKEIFVRSFSVGPQNLLINHLV